MENIIERNKKFNNPLRGADIFTFWQTHLNKTDHNFIPTESTKLFQFYQGNISCTEFED